MVRFMLSLLLLTALQLGPAGTPEARAHEAEPVIKAAQAVESLAGREQWKPAAAKTEALRKAYHGSKWKYQLLGDEEEYEQLARNIDRLRAAVRTRDRSQAVMTAADIVSIVKQIYSL
ncbi:DUF4363 family protein [Paenibacillus humicola]|uniref:DUF4363 family protein n=1 Tax=Paenibacillus humicola TaxID=3110540 RepID=UPI00237C1871|nr:DUF4363 family protein [Paenibacillus humicola]